MRNDYRDNQIPYILTAKERSDALLYRVHLERMRRARNQVDAERARAEAHGNAARLGVVGLID